MLLFKSVVCIFFWEEGVHVSISLLDTVVNSIFFSFFLYSPFIYLYIYLYKFCSLLPLFLLFLFLCSLYISMNSTQNSRIPICKCTHAVVNQVD